MEYVLLTLTGLLAGVLGGLLGVGGSIIMIPAMAVIFSTLGGRDESIHQYQAAAMIVNFLLIAPAVVRHRRAGVIVVGVWKWLAPAALVGILAGVAASRTSVFTGENEPYMRLAFGLFLFYVAGYNVYKLLGRTGDGRDPALAEKMAAWKKLGVGGSMGFAAGLLGIGGGGLAVPALQLVIRMPLRFAIGTSAATILTIAWLGAITKNIWLGDDGSAVRSLVLAGCLAPTAMIGGYLGGHLTHTLPLRAVRVAFILLMLLVGGKMLYGTMTKLGWIGHSDTPAAATQPTVRPTQPATAE